MDMNEEKIISCVGCQYYYITWERKHPKGCKYFGFKSLQMPCAVVKNTSGAYCNMYTPKSNK
jgi:hypothetical protein